MNVLVDDTNDSTLWLYCPTILTLAFVQLFVQLTHMFGISNALSLQRGILSNVS